MQDCFLIWKHSRMSTSLFFICPEVGRNRRTSSFQRVSASVRGPVFTVTRTKSGRRDRGVHVWSKGISLNVDKSTAKWPIQKRRSSHILEKQKPDKLYKKKLLIPARQFLKKKSALLQVNKNDLFKGRMRLILSVCVCLGQCSDS